MEPQASGGITGDKEFNIFEYIGRPTADRGVRKKQNGDKKRMGKLDALSILMSIAGASWEKDLVMGSKNEAGAGNTGRWSCSFNLIWFLCELRDPEKT